MPFFCTWPILENFGIQIISMLEIYVCVCVCPLTVKDLNCQDFLRSFIYLNDDTPCITNINLGIRIGGLTVNRAKVKYNCFFLIIFY